MTKHYIIIPTLYSGLDNAQNDSFVDTSYQWLLAGNANDSTIIENQGISFNNDIIPSYNFDNGLFADEIAIADIVDTTQNWR